MFRGDNLICGTSTTGTTSPLALAATPVAPGGIDLDAYARATGIGFGNSAVIPGVPYTLIEYTDSTFATVKQVEKGIGVLTLGSSSGIANATLSRANMQYKATSMNSQPASVSMAPGTAITIGTAANCLVFIGPSAFEIPACSPYIETSLGDAGYIVPDGRGGSANSQIALTSGYAYYQLIRLSVPALIKRAAVNLGVGYTGGTSNLYLRLYAVGTDGRPGKLLYDFGVVGTANSSLSGTGLKTTGASGNGFFILPGEYYIAAIVAFSGGSGSPAFVGYNSTTSEAFVTSGRVGTGWATPLQAFGGAFAGAGGLTPSTVDDPANQTSYSLNTLTYQNYLIGFKAS